MFTRLFRALGFAIIGLATIAMPALGQTSGRATIEDQPVAATLDGRSTMVMLAAQYHCHDLVLGQLTCFRSPQDRDEDVVGDDTAFEAAASSGYVVAYASPSYAGASVVLSQSYPNLGTIGWEDRISSYKVFTILTGSFFVNRWYSGQVLQFCCYAQVPYVGAAFDNTLSSFYLP
jgi:hypothetical protein